MEGIILGFTLTDRKSNVLIRMYNSVQISMDKTCDKNIERCIACIYLRYKESGH